jgi:hypothetical protein
VLRWYTYDQYVRQAGYQYALLSWASNSTVVLSIAGPAPELVRISPNEVDDFASASSSFLYSSWSAFSALAVFFFKGVANGLAIAPDDHPPNTDEEPLAVLKGDGWWPVAFEEEATGWDVNAEVCLTALKGEAEAEKAPKVAWAFFTGNVDDAAGVPGVSAGGTPLAARTLAAMAKSSLEVELLPLRPVSEGLTDANGDAADENEPNVAWGFLVGVAGTVLGVGTLDSTVPFSVVSVGAVSLIAEVSTLGDSCIKNNLVNLASLLSTRTYQYELTSASSSLTRLTIPWSILLALGAREIIFLFWPVSTVSASTLSLADCSIRSLDSSSWTVSNLLLDFWVSSWLRSSTFFLVSSMDSSWWDVIPLSPSTGLVEPSDLASEGGSIRFFFAASGAVVDV